MIKGFICPDKETICTEDCYRQCRMNNRCAPISFLRLVADEREWKGKPSVTQLQNGTLESYLKLTQDYFIDPNKMAFAVSGTKKHAALEVYGETPETTMELEGITGTNDDVEEDNGELVVIDHKTSGSFKVAQCLGIKIEKIKVPNGTYQNGKDKTKTISRKVAANPEWGEYLYQLNMYRIMLEKTKGLNIKRMKVFFVVRDGGTYISDSRGIYNNIYYQEVPHVNDEIILNYFTQKRDELLTALETNVTPQICSQEERWYGNKCEKYCEVRDICPRILRPTGDIQANDI